MKARRITLQCIYEGTDISKDIASFIKSISLREVLDGEADSVSLALHDREELWIGDWLPERGATMEITLHEEDWKAPGDSKDLPLGKFEIDEIENSGPPNEAKIKMVSVPYESSIRSVDKTHAWEKVKLSQIVKDIAESAGMGSYFEAEEDPVLERAEQSEETDLQFIKKLCKDAALALKVSDGKIIVFDIAKYEKADPVMEIRKGSSNLLSFTCRATIHDIYKACHVKYKHSKKEEFIEYTYQAPGREKGQTLEVNEKVETLAEAEKLAKKKLHEKNLEEISVSLTLAGDFALMASNTVTLAGFHRYDGKYIIKQSSHEIGNGYTTKVDLRRVIDGY